MSYDKILVGVDFSPESEVALAQALAIARLHGSELVLAHACFVPEAELAPALERHHPGPAAARFTELLRDHLRDNRERLAATRKRWSGQGAELSQLLVDAVPAEGLARAAIDVGAELIAVGTHGRTGLRRVLLGSVAERTVRFASCDVLVARPAARPHARAGAGYHHVLVATDFSPTAERATARAISLAAPGAVVDLLHCWRVPGLITSYATERAAMVAGELRVEVERDILTMGESLLDRFHRPDIKLTFSHLEDAAAHGIHRRLEDSDYDLVAVGSHGRRGLARALLGSVAEVTARHASCSTLVVHREREAREL